jgi:DNA-binding CsgD family transcriptional regulator
MDTVGPVISPLLVGRDELLELAERRLEEAAQGRGHLLLLAGEAGIGKTRLVRTILRAAEAKGAVCARGDLAPQDQDVPAASILDLARTMARDPSFGSLGDDLIALRDATAAAERAGRRMLVIDIVERIRAAVTGLTVLVFEDLQWADDLSLEVISGLARDTRDRPLLLIGAYRSDDAPPGTSIREWRSRLVTQRMAEEVRLTPLDLAQTALVTTLILDTGLPAPREVVAAVHERTDGIPLHIEELLGAMTAEARADGRAIREANVPATIEDATLARLGRFSKDAQAVAHAGAIIGRCFVPDVLAGIMDRPVDELDDPLQELIDCGVLYPAGSDGYIDFRHQLLRDAIYGSVPLRDRRQLHARAAEFGARLEGQSEIHASVHYERAGMREQAYEAALAGAREAARLSLHREAFDLYRRALDNRPEDLDAAARGELLEALALAAAALEEVDDVERLAREAAAAYEEAGDLTSAINILGMVVVMWRRDGRAVSERLDLLHDLIGRLETAPADHATDVVRTDMAYYLALAHVDAGDFEGARSATERARATKAGLDEPSLDLAVDELDGLLAFVEVGPAASIARLGATAEAAQRAGDVIMTLASMREASTMAARAMDYHAATRWIEDGVRFADAHEQAHCAHVMTATSAMVAWATGDWAGAAKTARQALADRGCQRAAMAARCALGYIAFATGDTATAEAELDAVADWAERSEAPDLILPPAWGRAESALIAGDPQLAAARAAPASELAVRVGDRALLTPFVVTGVRAHLATGSVEAASTWLDRCAEYLTGFESAAPALAHGHGLLALANGATGQAASRLKEAHEGWETRGRIWESTWARLDLAQALIRSNRFADALSLAVEARVIASRLDSRPLAERAEALQRMARGRVVTEEPWRPLTAREYSVARLISDGLTNAEIADQLGIAPKTASAHVEHILAKLGASRRTEIAAWASNVERSAAAS